MAENILLVTQNPNRYNANTQMKKVINFLIGRLDIYLLDISKDIGNNHLLENIKKISIKNDIKIILFIDGPPVLLLSISDLTKLRELFTISIFFGDIFAHYHSLYKYYAQTTDIALVDEVVEIGSFEKFCPKVVFVPYSYEMEPDFTPQKLTNQSISFVGRTDRRNRVTYIDICSQYGELEIFGVGSNKGPISDIEMKNVFNTTQVNLNFTGVQADQPFVYSRPIDNVIRSPKGRCQEIGMCGGFVLSEYAPGIEQMFSVGKEMDIFRNEEELRHKLDFYLKNPDITFQMAQLHQLNCSKNYSIQNIWEKTIEDITMAKVKKFENEYFTDDILRIAESRAWITYIKPILRQKSISGIFMYVKKIGWSRSFNLITTYLFARYLK